MYNNEYVETVVRTPYVNYNEVPHEQRPSRKRNWKPFALGTPFLIMLTVVLLACNTALEVLVRLSIPFSSPALPQDLHKRLVVTTANELDIQSVSYTTSTATSEPNYSFYSNPDARVIITSTTTAITTPHAIISTTPQAATTTTPVTLSSYYNPGGRVQITSSSTTSTTPLTKNTDSVALAKTSPTTKVTQQFGSVSDTKNVPNTVLSVITSGGYLITSTIVGSATRSRTFVTSTQTNLSDKISSLSRPDLQVRGTFTYTYYFMALFLPSIVAVVLRELWAVIACSVKLIEPFYLLSRPEGAKAKDSLMADYLSESSSWRSVKAAFRGSLLMIAVLVINFVMGIAAPLASESMTAVVLTKYKDENGDEHRENLAWVLFQPLVRILQGLLGFIALAIIFLAVLNRRRRSGLSGNPSKLVTMASLLNHPNMINEIQSIDHGASDSQIVQAFAHNRYAISSYRDLWGNERFGLVKVGKIVPHGTHRVSLEDITKSPVHAGFTNNQNQRGHTEHPWRDGLSLILIIGLLGTIIAYWFDGSDSAFNRFFNSGEFGPKFILSLIASTITTTFQDFEREVRSKTPYRRLASQQARAQNTVLRSVDGTAVSNLIQSIRQSTWFHLLIAVTALLGDVLIIAVVGVPFGENITQETYVYSSYASIAITTLMFVSIIMVFVWRRKNKKLNLPHKHDETLIRVWMSMSNQSNQLRAMLEDAGDMKEGQVAARVTREGGSYWAGWVRDERGREMWCIDKEIEYGTIGHRQLH